MKPSAPTLSLWALPLVFLTLLGVFYLLTSHGIPQTRALRNPLEKAKWSSNLAGNNGKVILRDETDKQHKEPIVEHVKRQAISPQTAVRNAMRHAWSGYRNYAFGKDEFQPLSKSYNLKWGDWAITLVDSLDTLKIMKLDDEYNEAKKFLRNMDFTRATPGYETMVFEMNIRALGGLLGAYEQDNDPMVLEKAKQVGDMLALAFDTPTGLPTSRIDVNLKRNIHTPRLCIAEGGTVQLEFQKLSQLTGDPKYRRLTDRASDALENGKRKYKGLYPEFIDIYTGEYDQSTDLSVGAMSDSFYEYQLKQYILNNRRIGKYKDQYITSSEDVKRKLVGQSAKGGLKFLGRWVDGDSKFVRQMEHLACFYPGLLALGSHVLGRPQDLALAKELARTCYLSYKLSPTGLGPELLEFPLNAGAPSQDDAQRAGQQMSEMDKYGFRGANSVYYLRPETVESIFVLYRVTGDPMYQDWGWEIFTAIEKYTRTPYGYAAYANVYNTTILGNQRDVMESFFLAETLKYLYLLFSPTDTISLDEYVFNTEAHPLKIIK